MNFDWETTVYLLVINKRQGGINHKVSVTITSQERKFRKVGKFELESRHLEILQTGLNDSLYHGQMPEKRAKTKRRARQTEKTRNGNE